MMGILGTTVLVGLVGVASAVNASLPTVDLGYEIQRASGFNDTGRFYNFSNIRFAAAPVGELRFALPAAPAENRSTIQTGDVGRICPQATPAWDASATNNLVNIALRVNSSSPPYVAPGANSSSPVPPRGPLETEDCLFLDVFVPEKIFEHKAEKKGSGAAVLVWVYGGGYVGGNKYNNPAGLLAASGNVTSGEVIYVSINYRLGALGWMGGPGYQAEGGVSNLGLYDQRFALEWVQKYIHLFGGDKNRVTVFGESAGAGSIMHQITAFGGDKGPVPFQQAVPQSPGWSLLASQTVQEDHYRKFLNLTGSTSLAELRNLSSDAILKANAQQIIYDTGYASYIYGPVVDGNFVPLLPGQLLAQGRFAKEINVMVGHNADEGAYFTPPYATSDEAIRTQLSSAFGNMPTSSLDYVLNVLYPPIFDGSYGYKTQYDRATLIVSESVFTCNTNYLSTGFKNKTYSYLFAVPPAFHGLDVPYTYYDGGALSSTPLGVYNRTVAIALQDFITSFAETGVPAAKGVRMFNMYGENAQVLELDVDGIEEIRDSNSGKRCSWWQLGLIS